MKLRPPAVLAPVAAGLRFQGLRLSAHRQQAISGDALVRHDAEEAAGRHACIIGDHLEVATGGKSLAQLPGVNRGNREAQVFGNFLQRDVVLPSPSAERRRKAGADVALEVGLFGHT